jgi:tetratricopeptide (TPR) repeat protein
MANLADIALSLDDQLPEAYLTKGNYYRIKDKVEQANIEYDKALKLNPNDWEAYWLKGRMYHKVDVVKAIDNYLKAAQLHRGPFLPWIYKEVGALHGRTGFREKKSSI